MEIKGLSPINEFQKREPAYKRLLEEALFILERGLRLERVKYHSIPTRIKSFESFTAKLKRKTDERKDAKVDPFVEVTDIVGLRVVCLFLSDIARVGKVIKDHFDILAEDNKIDGADVSSFGYMSVHFVANIKPSYSGPRYDDLVGIPLEIQVRTIAMDAWATISHYLSYKSAIDVPSEMRRDFYALSGLFYVADSHFEMFFKGRESSRIEIAAELEAGSRGGLTQEINLDSLSAFLASRFPDRERNDSETISELVQELHEHGYRSLEQLNDAIAIGYDGFMAYEKGHPPAGSDTKVFSDVGVVRMLLALVDKAYREKKYGTGEEFRKYESMIRARS
jgi:ppGpp synthetase/RelA/SpoT-type nucleotidyltranferase